MDGVDKMNEMNEMMRGVLGDMSSCQVIENLLRGKAIPKTAPQRRMPRGRGGKDRKRGRSKVVAEEPLEREVSTIIAECVAACKKARKERKEEEGEGEDLSDAALSQYARFTDSSNLVPFAKFLHYVPRLVNVVTLAEALPMKGSNLKLPLDLGKIAERCSSAYYAPKRFAAVQLAYSEPRCRVLIFHTGRLVGTGCQGAAAARLAIAKAQRQLAVEADVHLHVRNFAIINTVGAVALRATLNCDGFATAHSYDSHFDRSSFVGLAWRPQNESIICEVYSTGRANLPGSVAERQLLGSFSRMLPELLRYSSASHLVNEFPEALRNVHRVKSAEDADDGEAEPTRAQTTLRGKRALMARDHEERLMQRSGRGKMKAFDYLEQEIGTVEAAPRPEADSWASIVDRQADPGGLEAALDEDTEGLDLSAFGM